MVMNKPIDYSYENLNFNIKEIPNYSQQVSDFQSLEYISYYESMEEPLIIARDIIWDAYSDEIWSIRVIFYKGKIINYYLYRVAKTDGAVWRWH